MTQRSKWLCAHCVLFAICVKKMLRIYVVPLQHNVCQLIYNNVCGEPCGRVGAQQQWHLKHTFIHVTYYKHINITFINYIFAISGCPWMHLYILISSKYILVLCCYCNVYILISVFEDNAGCSCIYCKCVYVISNCKWGDTINH